MNILLLRLRLIGDVVFTTPFIRAVRRAHPDASLTYLVEPDAAPVVINNPHLDAVMVAPRVRGLRRLAADLNLARRLRSRHFDIAIDLHGGPRSGWLAWASGAKTRVGYDIPGRAWMYTDVIPRARELRPRHSVENQWDLLAGLPGWTGAAAAPGADPVEMTLDAAADARIADRLRAAGLRPDTRLVLIHVSAGNPFRRWPETAFADVAAALADDSSDRRVIFSSGPSDRDASARIAAAARSRLGPHASRVLDIGEFDLQELRALIARSALFIGGDTGPLHIAATTTTPIVGIFGPTLPARSAAWRDPALRVQSVELTLDCRPCNQRTCVHGDFRCLTQLAAAPVIAAAQAILDGRTTRAVGTSSRRGEDVSPATQADREEAEACRLLRRAGSR